MGSFENDPLQTILIVVLFVLSLLIALCTALVFLYGIYFLLTLPMRRNERARIFLDLLELGLKNGQSPEQAIVEASSCRDGSLGVRFHWLARELQAGVPLELGLVRVRRLLPAQVMATLRVGARLGDISKVLPACRLGLRDAVSKVRGALNYLLLLGFILIPASITIPIMFHVKVLPQFRAVFQGMAQGTELPGLSRVVFEQNALLTWVQVLVLLCTWVIIIGYLGGPRLRAWLAPALGDLPDRLDLRLPWRRKRLQRDFSAMLAILLDGGMPESEAVALAAGSTANRLMVHRAEKLSALLRQGDKLPEALRVMDDSSELRWRFSNASQRGGGFLSALSGWHQALDDKAFQLEQAAAQLATAGLVLCNGLIVGLVIAGVFAALIRILNSPALW